VLSGSRLVPAHEEVVPRVGDYDQAHVIGDFQQLTGQSAAAYAALNLADGGGVLGD
jgi:hypothetical protein